MGTEDSNDSNMKKKGTESAQVYLDHLLKNGSNVEQEQTEMQLPPWQDEELCKKSQRYLYKYFFAIFGSMFSGLVSVLAIPSILRVLVCTKQSSTVKMAYRRYVETIFHVLTWHDHPLKPGTPAWESLEIVRNKHAKASKHASKSQQGIVSQKDLAITQFGFMGYLTLIADVYIEEDDRKDFYESITHFWRVIGYVLGIRDEFNLCTDSWETTKPRLILIRDEIYKPALENTGKDFEEATKALVDGMWYFNPGLEYTTAVFATKWMTRCDGYQYFQSDFESWPSKKANTELAYKKLTLYQRFSLAIAMYALVLYKNKYARMYFNFRVIVLKLMAVYFPIFGAYKFGLKWAYVKIFNKKEEKAHEN